VANVDGSEVAPVIQDNRFKNCSAAIYLQQVKGNAQVEILDNQFEEDVAGTTNWGIFSWEGSFHAKGNTFTRVGQYSNSWLHGGAIAGLNVNSGTGGPGLTRSLIEENTLICKDGSAIEGYYSDFQVMNNTITKEESTATNKIQKTLWMHRAGATPFSADTAWQIEGNTITGPGSSVVGEVGIYAEGTTSGTSQLTFVGANTISGFDTGIEVGADAKAKVVDATITGNGTGVRVDGGTALIQGCDLKNNTTAALNVLNDGIVDAGQSAAPSDFTGMGTSTGGNDFSSYTSSSGPYAIVNDNVDSVSGAEGVPPDVKAENNLFYSSVLENIQNVVVHDGDLSTRGYVDFDPPQSTLWAADGPKPSDPNAVGLTLVDLEPIIVAAMDRWYRVTRSQKLLDEMSQAEFVIADLPGGMLGVTDGNTITIDWDAAGYGWFVDLTPSRDEEYRGGRGRGELQAIDPRAVDRMDLLTVVEHELGHIVGLQDLGGDGSGLMSGTLDSGIRRLPLRSGFRPLRRVAELDQIWAEYGQEFADRRQARARLHGTPDFWDVWAQYGSVAATL
ncbi:hypothetical protein ACFL5Q_06300, partial [Planctomycetota bacterium]